MLFFTPCQVALAGSDDSFGGEQLQHLRAGAAWHGQEPHLQGNFAQLHSGVGWTDHRGQPVLQHGCPQGGAGGLVGRGGF